MKQWLTTGLPAHFHKMHETMTEAYTQDALRVLALLPIERQGDWLDACLLYGGGHEFEFVQVASVQEAAGALRHDSCDLVIVWVEGTQAPSCDTCMQLLELANHTGLVAIGMHAPEGWQHAYIEMGAITCVDMDTADPMSLVHALRNACELTQLRLEEREWRTERARAQQRERRDVERLLVGQQQLLERLDGLGGEPGHSMHDERYGANDTIYPGGSSKNDPLALHYRHCLQQYLFDENGHAQQEISEIVEQLAMLELGSSGIMRLHLNSVSEVTEHGGAGALRHCLASADRFLVEILMRLVDQTRSQNMPAKHYRAA